MTSRTLFWIPVMVRLVLLLAAGFTGWAVWDFTRGLAIAFLILLTLIFVQLRYMYHLSLWLDRPEEVKLKDGRKFQNKMEKLSGWIGQPLTRQQRLAKFDACTRHILTPDAAHRMLELVENLEKLESICEVMDIARCDTNKPNK